jgi:hypothetical protein
MQDVPRFRATGRPRQASQAHLKGTDLAARLAPEIRRHASLSRDPAIFYAEFVAHLAGQMAEAMGPIPAACAVSAAREAMLMAVEEQSGKDGPRRPC